MSASIVRTGLAVALIGAGTAHAVLGLKDVVAEALKLSARIDAFVVIAAIMWLLPAAIVAAGILWRYAGEAQGAPRAALQTVSAVCGVLGTSFVIVVVWNSMGSSGALSMSDIASLLAAPALLLGLWLFFSKPRNAS